MNHKIRLKKQIKDEKVTTTSWISLNDQFILKCQHAKYLLVCCLSPTEKTHQECRWYWEENSPYININIHIQKNSHHLTNLIQRCSNIFLCNCSIITNGLSMPQTRQASLQWSMRKQQKLGLIINVSPVFVVICE